MTYGTRILLVAIATGIWMLDGAVSATAQVKQVGGDRLGVVAGFLRAVYPDLLDQPNGVATLQIDFSHGTFITGTIRLSLNIRPCRQSGISVERTQLPYCGEVPLAGEKPLLSAGVGLGPDKDRPIAFGFNASGSFIDAKLQAVRDQFKDRVYADLDLRDKQRYWTKDDALKALQSSNPKYGPDRKKEFVASLPIQGIQETTGCKLRVDTTEFVVLLLNTQLPQLQWSVHGDAAATEASAAGDCWALFEPFDGRLTAMGF